jgi:uncharacterized LabA/DUF88 family protein
MHKFAIFVNGSHLFGAFKHMEVYVNDYESLYRYLFEQAARYWRGTCLSDTPPPAQLVRVYWYVVDSIDEWDLNNPRTRQYLQERFMDDREVRGRWMEAARQAGNTERVEQTAFDMCFDDFRAWYEKKQNILGGMNRFYHAVEAASDFVEVCRCGRWKADLLHKTLTEKGLDVWMATDMMGLQQNYDVALVIAPDSDPIPSIDYVKSRGKQVGIFDFQRGATYDQRARSFASQLRLSTDFVTTIYESELVRLSIATKGEGEDFG